MDCPICSKQHCLVCASTPYHDGETCAEHKAEVDAAKARAAATSSGGGAGGGGGSASAEADEAATQRYLQASNIRICKRCNVPLIKESGCDKMKCRCGYRFCYQVSVVCVCAHACVCACVCVRARCFNGSA